MTELERVTMRRVAWRLLPFLLLLYIISWLDRVNVGFAKLQMSGDLGLSETVYGIGAGIFFIGYGLCEVPSNLLLVRYGARIWIARIMITWGLISAAMMFVQGTNSFYVLRFLLGVAEAGFLPGIIFYLGQWFPREQRAKAVSWFMIGIPLSVVFGGPLSGWLLGFEGHLGLHGWQWMYLAEGLPAVILGFVVLGFLTDKPADARWLTAEQRTWLAERIESENAAAKTRHGLGLGAALTHPTVWLLALIMFCCQTGSYGLTLWVPTIVKNLSGFTNLEVGFFSAIPYIAAALGMVLIGRSSDRTRRALPAHCDSVSDRRGRFRRDGTHQRAGGGIGCVVRGRRRRLRDARAVLGIAGQVPVGQRGGRRDRVDKFPGRFRRLHRPVDGRHHEGCDRQLRERAVPARGHPAGRRRAHAGIAQVTRARRLMGTFLIS